MNWFTKWFEKKKRLADFTEEDCLRLGARLVVVLSVSIEPDVTTVKLLKDEAKKWAPDLPEVKIELEIFLFHKFLLVQALPPSQKILGAFYKALDEIMTHPESPLYVSRFIQARIKTSPEALATFEQGWITRAKYYEGPFEQDNHEWLEKGKSEGYIPWQRTLLAFLSLLRKPTEREALKVTSIMTRVVISTTFAGYLKQSTDIITGLRTP